MRSKALKARAVELEQERGNSGLQARRFNDTRATAGDEPVRLQRRSEPLKGEPWTRLRGETNLQGR
jgi:hypothetical protein